jgi:DNA polymerase III alpha subunit
MPEHVVRLAVERGCRAVALTDPNLHGAVEFFIAAKDAGMKPVIGAEITVGTCPIAPTCVTAPASSICAH